MVRKWLGVLKVACSAAKTSPKLCFQLRKLTEGVFFIVDLNVPFWHRGSEKYGSKMAFVNRPGHAVSLLRNCHFWLVLCVVGVLKVACSAAKTSSKLCFSYEIMFFRLFHLFCCQNFIETVFSATKAHRSCVFCSGFKRAFLTSGVGEIWFENGLRESTRPCFAAAELSFLAGSWCGGGIEGSLFCCQNSG